MNADSLSRSLHSDSVRLENLQDRHIDRADESITNSGRIRCMDASNLTEDDGRRNFHHGLTFERLRQAWGQCDVFRYVVSRAVIEGLRPTEKLEGRRAVSSERKRGY